MAKYCTYCKGPLKKGRDERGIRIYICSDCGKRFIKKKPKKLQSEVEPYPTLISSAMKFREILRDAEIAYKDALEILKNLDNRQNRLKISNMLVRAGYTDFKEVDFEGAKIDPLSERKPELSKRYGIRIYPMTLVIHPERMDRVKAKIYGRGISRSVGGVCLVLVKDYPFGKLGGLRLSFSSKMSDRSVAEHEDIHGSWHIYRGSGDEDYTPEEAHEASILNELNSYRSGMQYKNFMESGERHDFEEYWYDIEEDLVNKRVPKMIEWIEDEKAKETERKRLTEIIDEMVNIMIELQLEYDEIVITRILLKSRNLEQLRWWVKRKNVLDEWHKRAIRGKENEIKKHIVSKMNFMTPIDDIKNDAYNRVGEYWRFKGKFGDRDARWKHVNSLIEDALKSCDDDVKDFYGKGEEEGKKGLEKLAEEVEKGGDNENGKKGLKLLIKDVDKEKKKKTEKGKKGLKLLIKD